MENLTNADIVTLEHRILEAEAQAWARLEAAALRWCETMGAKLDAKKSGYKPKRRGWNHADHS